MKRFFKGIVTLIVVLMVAATSVACQSNVGKPLSNNVEREIKYYGQYAQKVVSDANLIQKIEAAASTVDENGRIKVGNIYYEKVESAAPYKEGALFSDGTAIKTGSTYYFEVSPVAWQIVKKESGKTVLFAQSILDVACFSERTEMEGCGFGFLYSGKDYPNDWAISNLRTFMNVNMYGKMFDATNAVLNTRNSSAYPQSFYSAHSAQIPDTDDKLYAPSYAELTSEEYGYTEDGEAYDCLRMAEPTDYAKAKGCRFFEINAREDSVDYERDTELNGNGEYWLRTVGQDIYYAGVCRYTGTVGKYYTYVNTAVTGVRPMVTVGLTV